MLLRGACSILHLCYPVQSALVARLGFWLLGGGMGGEWVLEVGMGERSDGELAEWWTEIVRGIGSCDVFLEELGGGGGSRGVVGAIGAVRHFRTSLLIEFPPRCQLSAVTFEFRLGTDRLGN